MRKTKLIPLPNQVEPHGGSTSSSQDGEGSSLVPQSVAVLSEEVRATSPMGIVPSSSVRDPQEVGQSHSPPTMDDFLSFNRITFNANVQPRPVSHQIQEEQQRSSEPQYVANQVVREVPIVRTNVEFGHLDHHHPPTAPSFDQLVPQSPPATMTIPRQLGRRSDQSPRILAINAESNTILLDGSRPTSAPARVGLVQRGEVVNEDVRRSVRDNGNHRRGEFDSMSSVASSRNPSPVSLGSSSGSSMASAQGSPER